MRFLAHVVLNTCGAPPSKNAKNRPFALHMQYITNLCSKTNKIYTRYMHFRGFHVQKAFASGAAPRGVWT